MTVRPTLLCLHGWGGSSSSFDELRQALTGADLTILTPDLPGFGQEAEPTVPWTVDDYGHWVVDFAARHIPPESPLLLLGHSHGGRIAIKLVAQKTLTPKHLFLCAPAINRHHRYRLRRKIGFVLAKTGKAILDLPGLKTLTPYARTFLYKLMRVHDYERASPIMQKTLVLVTQDDLTDLLPKVNVPTDVFWGTDDRLTPVEDGKLLKQSIPHCHLHVFPGVRHAVHRDRATDIAAAVRQSL